MNVCIDTLIAAKLGAMYALDGMQKACDDVDYEDAVPLRPPKNLIHKGYLQPTFSVKRCARSKVRKKSGRLFRNHVLQW